MKSTIRIIMALAIAMSVITKIYADQNQLQFRHIDAELGLSSNTVNHIIQDKKGFIWIGTDEGLDRIDGTSIKVFKPNINYTKFSMSNVVMLHLQDSEGKIWTSSLFDVFVFDPNIGRFIKFETKTLKGEQLTADITSVAEDHSKNIWFATRSKGIFCYNLNNKKLKRYDINKHAVYSILVDENNQIWAATNSSRHPIARFNRPREIFQDVNVRYNDSRQLPQIIYLYEDKFGSVYAGTWANGLLKFNRNANTLTIEQPSSQTMPMTHMHCLTKADDNNLWIGSDDGLLLYNTTRKSGKLYVKEDNNIITSLSSKFVYEAFQDREGGLWIGTYYGGVNYAPPFQDRFRSFSHSAQQNSVNGNIIAGFCEDENGQVWISSDDGAISCYNPATDLFKVFTSSNSGLSFDNTHAICADGKDIWIGTYTGGISVYNTISRKWRHYKGGNAQNLLYEGSSYAIKKDSHGTLWIGTMLGICKYNYATDDFTRMHQLSSLVIAIEEDNNGNVWFASQGDGLLCYKFEKKKWKEYTCKNSNLPTNQINCLRTDENGILWVGTCEGLYKYDENRMKFIPEEIQGSSKNIQCILSKNGLLWITTTNGLICHTPGKHDDRIYLKRDGLRSCQFTMNSGIIASDGRIYIGTDNGFNSFYPSNIKRNEYVAPIVITGLMLMNKEIQVSEDGPLHKSITNLDRIDLRYKDNVITLNFSSLSYCIPEKNQYAYYMEGFDKGWVKAGNRQSATYTNLSPGTYIFHVKGTNNDGVWNEKGTTLKIVIHPPFYLSWWAELLYLIVIGIIVWYIIKYYQKKTERHQQIHIEKVKQEKEKELYVAKISFFTMIAHEIRTPVSLIIGPLETILSKNLSDTVRNDLQTIERNSKRLLYLVNQLLDFRKVQQGSVAMRFSYQDVCQLIRVTVERFRPMAEQDGSKIAIKIPDEGIFADIDSEAITKVLSNLLMNAVKYTKDSIVVECYIKDEDQTLLIHVSDNGQGISEENMKKIFHPFYQGESNKPGTGIGLTIVRNMVELHHGSISVNSKLDQGTTFIVTLPLHQQGISTEEKISTNEISEIPTDIINMERNEKRNDGEKQLLLIVDDNEDMLTFLSQSFVDDYTIMTAENGEQALKLIDDNNFSLIISDWMMPVMDGADLCKAVRRNPLTSHIPFVLLTAKTDLDSKIEGMDTGADIFVEKPFSIHYLKSCIRNLIELRSMLIQKFSKMPLVPIKSIASHSEDERILNQINKIIEDNFSNPDLDVDLLAEKMNISRSSLYTKIKSISNQTPNELIQLLRLKKAAELLLEKKYRMNEICYMVGFNNPSYFSKCFLKQFGKRPSEYI